MGTLGERLKEERKRLGFSQEEFAAIAGVTRRPYAEWEAGNTSPTGVQLAALYAEGADVQYIVTGVRSGMALSPDERELLTLFRAAPLAGKAAAIGALQGVAASQAAPKVVVLGGTGTQIESNTAPIKIDMRKKGK